MVLLWVIYGFCMGYCFPYETHRCYCPLNDLHSVVFHYGISTYFALAHIFPIASTIGMVWLSSIPKPSPTTMRLLCISHHSLAFPYKSKHTAAFMGLLWVAKHHTIPISSKLTAADMGLLWVKKHHTIPILSKHTAAAAAMGILL